MIFKMKYNANEHGLQYTPLACLMLATALNQSNKDFELELDQRDFEYNCAPSESLLSPQFEDALRMLSDLGVTMDFERFGYRDILREMIVDYSLAPPCDVYAVATAFGCKRKCKYCPDYKHSEFITRHVEKVVSEIIQLYEMGVRYFEFTDNSVFNDIDHFRDIIWRIPRGMHWGALINIDSNVTEEQLDYFYACGCRRLYTGLESLNERDYKAFGKNFNCEPLEFVKFINSKIKLNAFIIRGLPYETDESWSNLIKELESNDISYTINHFFDDSGRADLIFDKVTADRLEALDYATTCKNLSLFLEEYL